MSNEDKNVLKASEAFAEEEQVDELTKLFRELSKLHHGQLLERFVKNNSIYHPGLTKIYRLLDSAESLTDEYERAKKEHITKVFKNLGLEYYISHPEETTVEVFQALIAADQKEAIVNGGRIEDIDCVLDKVKPLINELDSALDYVTAIFASLSCDSAEENNYINVENFIKINICQSKHRLTNLFEFSV